ncbi:MAG: FAM83 family protein [Prevotellaceae bacterium]|nr:FAM83 family protein [Prevotellaceae bacterium]
MMENKIQPISKSQVIDYSDQPLQNFWRQKADKTLSAKSHREQITEILQSATEGIVCVQTEALTDKYLIKQIFDTSQGRKVKIYILVNEYSEELNQLNEICLIRFGGLKNIGTFVLANPNSKTPNGIFFGGQLTEQSIAVSEHISRELEMQEITELFRHFCFHFWKTAKKEIIEKGKPTDVVSKPLDIFHDVNAFDGKDFVYGTLFDFVETAKRSEMSGKFIVPLNQETQIPTLINPNSEVDLQDNKMSELLPFADFDKKQPELKDDGVSVKRKYSWQNVPFYLPDGSKENSLYEKWQQEQKKIINHLDMIIGKIDTARKKKGLSNMFSKIIFKRNPKLNEFENEIDGFKQIVYSELTEMKLQEKIKSINEIHKQIDEKISEIDQEDKNVQLDEEIENLKVQISEQQTALKNKQSELDTKKQENEQKLIDFCTANEVEKDKLYKLKNQWEQEAKNKKDKEKSELANQKLSELQQIQKDVFLQKCIDDKYKIEQEIKRLENAVKNKEQEKNKQLQQSVSSSSLDYVVGNKNQSKQGSNQKTLLEVPNLPQLPKIGKLYQLNSQPYLAIEFWEQYEQGKAEADRLKAKLCVIK